MAIPLAIGAAVKGASVFDLLGGPSVLSGLPSLSGGDATATAFSSATQNASQTTGDFNPSFGGSAGQIATASLVPLVIGGAIIVGVLALLKGSK